MDLRRLFPDQATVSVDQAASGLGFGDRAPADRPFIALNMVSSADGKATLAGETAPMSAPVDRELFHHLRTQADGILVGAGTVRAERYGPVTKTADLQAKREREDVRPEALCVIATRSGALPDDLPLLTKDPDSVRLLANVREGLKALRNQGIRSLLCEGGPTLNATLFAESLIDELFLTVAPTVAGAAERLTLVEGAPLPKPVELELVTVHEAHGHLFTRYRVS
ncbi:MAG TPA: dihydrofolate reductase family protein [Thermoleophilaceae bacterium]|nr:dihydrofolate reductase family protein [Thermoleophilaceae bacterium]